MPAYHKIKKVKRQHKIVTKNFDYTTIAYRLRTVSWINCCHPAGVVNSYVANFLTNLCFTAKALSSERDIILMSREV